MLNLLRCEFYKLKTNKIIYVVSILCVFQAIGVPILSSNLRGESGKGMLVFSLSSQPLLLLVMFIGVFSYFIANEFSSGCVKNLISYGHKRTNIIISKSIAFYAGIGIMSLIFPALITIINTVINGFGEPFTINSILFLFRVTSLMLLVHIAMASIAVMLAYVSRNIIITIGAYVCLDTVNRLGQAFSMRIDSARVIYEKTVFGLPNIAVVDSITSSQVLQVVLISLVTIALSTLIAMYFFKKADIK